MNKPNIKRNLDILLTVGARSLLFRKFQTNHFSATNRHSKPSSHARGRITTSRRGACPGFDTLNNRVTYFEKDAIYEVPVSGNIVRLMLSCAQAR